MSEVLAEQTEQTEPTSSPAVVKGRIKVADEVVEKVAALAALEVAGVADMGGDLARAFESVRDRIGIGSRRGNQGVSAEIQDRQVAVNLVIVVEYGHVVMEVAAEVKTNVARTVSRMLGMRVTEVNVTVDDVRLPGEPRPAPDPDPDISPIS
ncbi:Asp23/Gls24 family envelope stress response protein [Nonomuraea endophytica]|uniref:Asp23/Gls24 family envelope stress response protein n=1 Tax=Nonomuraea endophytica TaxID=714136 RepID=UPI0037C80566